jgi:protein PhnA
LINSQMDFEMTPTNDDYVYDETSGEWISAEEAAGKAQDAGRIEVRDSAGNLLADGDSVITIKDLKVKGAGQTLRKATDWIEHLARRRGDPQEIDCRYEGIKGLVLRAEFVRKH